VVSHGLLRRAHNPLPQLVLTIRTQICPLRDSQVIYHKHAGSKSANAALLNMSR